MYDGGTIGVTVPDEKTVKYLFKNLLSLIDKNLLPHIGLSSQYRHTKLRYLGHLIHKMLLVEMQIEDSTDRDSLTKPCFLQEAVMQSHLRRNSILPLCSRLKRN